MSALDWRCPICRVRYPGPGRRGDGIPVPYVCTGGWPDGNPGAPVTRHEPVSTEPIPGPDR